ncbi:hypothetical protein DFQ14_11154 [Halopolyspora algeriensis]|uniref:Uncharacterized protein n=1 Tax=Halopolyspora algeriensis TaxID=1500506 RepID=A0A368VL59_9ACTN|nr:hypothetical protein [Halopolyspora algeriensis]RCW40405.1 hypothetical protein DFQ14_11154 [Halopolyspora algeriensis]TQM53689.1 hypothetical protein FHU43_1851 [Halopolyspora algeriensis]
MATEEGNEPRSGEAVPQKAVKSAAGFVGEHGGSARAVVENVGHQAGARIVLIGADGALGDVMVADVATAESVVGAVEELELSDWDADTTAALKIGPEHRRRMARSHASRSRVS